MLKRLISHIFKSNVSEEVRPPVDLNRPVENPELVKAIDALMTHDCEQTRHNLGLEVRKAVYLLPFLADEDFHASDPDSEGQTIIKKGSLMKILHVSDAQGDSHLALFTDWGQIGAWTKEAVNTLVLPAKDAWAFALNGPYAGVVINPGGNALPLSKEALVELLKDA